MFAVFICSLALAQTAPKFSYQAVVRNASNELVADDTVLVKISFFNHEDSGVAVYSERHSVVSNANGLVSLMIGEGTEISGNLLQVTWDDALVSIEITLRGGYSVSDIRPVTAVPFAYYAERIPLQALEEHLGSTNLVSADALRDTLSHYVTVTGLSDTLLLYATTSALTDTLTHYVTIPLLSDSLGLHPTRPELSDSLARYVTIPLLSDSLGLHPTRPELSDSLARYVTSAALSDSISRCATRPELSDSLANYVTSAALEAALQGLKDEINAVATTVDNITVTNSHITSNQFVLAHSPMASRKALLFINGVLISQNAYNVMGNRVVYIPENNGDKYLEEGDRIQIYYYYN